MRSSYAVSLIRHKVHNPGDNPLGQKCGQLAHFHNSLLFSRMGKLKEKGKNVCEVSLNKSHASK